MAGFSWTLPLFGDVMRINCFPECAIDFPGEEKPKPESGESLKDGLSRKKPLRGPYERVPGRVESTDYYNPLTPEGE